MTTLNDYLQKAPERMDVKDVATMQNLAHKRIAELEKFVLNFLDNFQPCEYCERGQDDFGNACYYCGGVDRQVTSKGYLISDLFDEAEKLLKGNQS